MLEVQPRAFERWTAGSGWQPALRWSWEHARITPRSPGSETAAGEPGCASRVDGSVEEKHGHVLLFISKALLICSPFLCTDASGAVSQAGMCLAALPRLPAGKASPLWFSGVFLFLFFYFLKY